MQHRRHSGYAQCSGGCKLGDLGRLAGVDEVSVT